MGKIFAFSDVLYNNVPTPDNFVRVKDIFTDIIQRDSAFIGAIHYGSTASHNMQYSMRSDFDAFVVYERRDEKFVMDQMRELHAIASAEHVPLNIQLLDNELAGTRFHKVYLLYYKHLEMVAQTTGFIKANPLLCVTPATTDVVQDALQYTGLKIQYIVNARNETEDDRLRLLQKVIEVPIHAARKLLFCHNQLPWPDHKQAVLERYGEIAKSQDAALLQELVKVDQAYTEHVRNQLRIQRKNMQAYNKQLSRMTHPVKSEVIRFLRICMRDLNALV